MNDLGPVRPGRPPQRSEMRAYHCLPCPECGDATRVVDTRPTSVSGMVATRRRRECNRCGHRFRTTEVYGADVLSARLSEADQRMVAALVRRLAETS